MRLEDMIQARHDPPEWAVIFEFANSTGWSNRRADAVAFNCWPSKEFLRIAYEVKRSRSDFMREVDNPEKRAWLEKHFHQCYFVVAHGIVKEDEVPTGWGLLVATKNGDKLIRRKAAQHRDVDPMPQGMVLAAIRRLTEQLLEIKGKHYTFDNDCITQADLDKKVQERFKSEREAIEKKREEATKKITEARNIQTTYEEPFAALASAAGDFQYAHRWTGPARVPPTVEQINAWVADIRRKAVFSVLGSLKSVYAQIGVTLKDMEKAGLGDLPVTVGKHQRSIE